LGGNDDPPLLAELKFANVRLSKLAHRPPLPYVVLSARYSELSTWDVEPPKRCTVVDRGSSQAVVTVPDLRLGDYVKAVAESLRQAIATRSVAKGSLRYASSRAGIMPCRRFAASAAGDAKTRMRSSCREIFI